MNRMEPLARTKTSALTTAVTTDPRWVLQDELMCQVFGFTLYGYALGVGRVVCFMDVADIQEMAAGELAGLGIGPKYAAGLMAHAHEEFMKENNQSFFAQLVNVGHSYFVEEDISGLVESVFSNTKLVREHLK